MHGRAELRRCCRLCVLRVSVGCVVARAVLLQHGLLMLKHAHTPTPTPKQSIFQGTQE